MLEHSGQTFASNVRVAVLGTGLIGASFGLAVRKHFPDAEVAGFDVEPGRAIDALERGALTSVADGPAAVVTRAEIVLLAAPVDSIPGLFAEVSSHLAPGAIVTDAGSTKARIVSEISERVPPEAHFIGGHPLAGSEGEGAAAAWAEMFEGCTWVLTPGRNTEAAALGRLARFLGMLGAGVLALTPRQHDEMVAITSHFPQLLSSLLMTVADRAAASEGTPLVVGGGFRDMTRIAAANPQLWMGILKENREAVIEVAGVFEEELHRVRLALAGGAWPEVEEALAGASRARRDLTGKSELGSATLVEILIAVPDRPGVLAEIATTLGERGINIEDLGIVHASQGGRGTLHLAVAGEKQAQAAFEAVTSKGYSATIAGKR